MQAYDPEAMEESQRLYGEQTSNGTLTLCDTNEATLNHADALIIVTEWKNFQAPNF